MPLYFITMDDKQEIIGTLDYQNVIVATRKVFGTDEETAKEVIGLELKTLKMEPDDVRLSDLNAILRRVVHVFCNGNGGSEKALDNMYLQLSYLREKPSHITEYNSRTSLITS